MLQPIGRFQQSLRQEVDIETEAPGANVDLLFSSGQQVQKQRGESALLQNVRHVTISRAVPATAAAMRKQDDTGGGFRNGQISRQADRRNLYGALNDGVEISFEAAEA